jgi:hypothetical protein
MNKLSYIKQLVMISTLSLASTVLAADEVKTNIRKWDCVVDTVRNMPASRIDQVQLGYSVSIHGSDWALAEWTLKVEGAFEGVEGLSGRKLSDDSRTIFKEENKRAFIAAMSDQRPFVERGFNLSESTYERSGGRVRTIHLGSLSQSYRIDEFSGEPRVKYEFEAYGGELPVRAELFSNAEYPTQPVVKLSVKADDRWKKIGEATMKCAFEQIQE